MQCKVLFLDIQFNHVCYLSYYYWNVQLSCPSSSRIAFAEWILIIVIWRLSVVVGDDGGGGGVVVCWRVPTPTESDSTLNGSTLTLPTLYHSIRLNLISGMECSFEHFRSWCQVECWWFRCAMCMPKWAFSSVYMWIWHRRNAYK